DRQQLLLAFFLRRARNHAGHHAFAHVGLVPPGILALVVGDLLVVRLGRGFLLALLGFLFRLRRRVLPLFVVLDRFRRDEREARLHFGVARRSTENRPVRLLDAGGVVGFLCQRSREPLGLLLHEVAVHEEQALQRNARREPFLRGEIRAREVEELQ